MPKNLEINLSDEKFRIFEDNSELFSIDKNTLIINGKDIYEKLFLNIETDKEIVFNIEVSSEISDSNDKRIAKDIKTVIEGIVSKINNKFNLMEDEEDSSLQVSI